MANTKNTAPTRATLPQYAFRLAVLLGLTWLGVTTAASMRTLLSPPTRMRTEWPNIDESLALMPAAGSWRFDGVQTFTTSSTPHAPTIPVRKSDRFLTIEEPTFKGYVEMNGRAEVSSATLAMQLDDDWHVVQLGSDDAPCATPHLLPLGEAKRLCGRWSDDDRLLLEIVMIDAGRAELLNSWRQAGWEIRHTAWGGPQTFSFLCAKRGKVVYAWSKQSDQIRSLLLSSSADVALRRTTSKNGNDS